MNNNNLSTDNKHISYITETWTLQKERNMERRESLILKETNFSVNNDNAIAWKYIDLRSRRSSAVQKFQKANNCLKMAKQGRNMYQLMWF
jgi:hypothetical protein